MTAPYTDTTHPIDPTTPDLSLRPGILASVGNKRGSNMRIITCVPDQNSPNGLQHGTTEAPGVRRRYLERTRATSSAPLTCQVKAVSLTFLFASHDIPPMHRDETKVEQSQSNRTWPPASKIINALRSLRKASCSPAARYQTIY